MREFFRYLWNDYTNRISFTFLLFFFIIGIYFCIKDTNGWENNKIWVIAVLSVGVFWLGANVIDYLKHKK